MGGSSGSSKIRYAPYLEIVHDRYLGYFEEVFLATRGASPYGDYEQIDVKDGFFGIRTDDPTLTYEIKNFPSLWDMFGKFQGGLDIHDLWGQVYEDVVQGPEIENAVSAQSALLQDDIDTNVMPKFLAGMRDINSVQSTAFIVGKAIIQSAHVKSINRFSSQIKVRALDMANDQWAKHLSWNESVLRSYSEMFKLYYNSQMSIDGVNLEYQVKDKMWDINLFEPARAIIGAIQGAAATTDKNEPSQTQKSIGYTAAGAAAGSAVYPGWGTLIGAVLGLAASFL